MDFVSKMTSLCCVLCVTLWVDMLLVVLLYRTSLTASSKLEGLWLCAGMACRISRWGVSIFLQFCMLPDRRWTPQSDQHRWRKDLSNASHRYRAVNYCERLIHGALSTHFVPDVTIIDDNIGIGVISADIAFSHPAEGSRSPCSFACFLGGAPHLNHRWR